MEPTFPDANGKWRPVLAVGIAFVMAVGLFLLLPLTQSLDPPEKSSVEVREVSIATAPPPPPAPPEEKPPEDPTPRPSDPPPSPETISVGRLDVSLSTSPEDAVSMGVSPPEFATESDAVGEIESLFTFEDLPEAPRLVHAPSYSFPRSLERRGVEEGRVVVEIDILPDGSARLRRIISSTHRELEPVARRIIEGARFTRPTIDGEVRRVRGHFPLVLRL